MKRKGPTLCLLPILLIPFLLIAQEKNTKTKARILTRSSVIENPPPTKGPEQHAKFDPNARIVNVSAALFEVGTQDLNGVSQNDLKELVEFAIRNGAKDKMNLAVAVQAGKSAKVKGVTQIWSPNHFVPAKVHPSKDDKSSYSITKGKSSPNAVSYIIPTQAAQFAMTELGYQLEVTPEINADDSIKLSGQIVDKTLMGFETNSTPITMTKKSIAGSRRTHIGDDNRVTPKIRSQKRTFAVKQLKGAHYLPFRINQPNNFKLPTHPSATDQNKIDRFNQVLPPPSLREAPSRSGILVLKAETKAKQPARDKSPEKPKREKKSIYPATWLRQIPHGTKCLIHSLSVNSPIFLRHYPPQPSYPTLYFRSPSEC